MPRCPACRAENDAEARVCHGCGEALSSAAGGRRPTTSVQAAMGPGTRPARAARLVHLHEDGREEILAVGHRFAVGRREGDLVVDDPYLSSRQFEVRREGSHFVLTDLGSTNGTFIRVDGEVELRPGDYVLMGRQLFRFLT